MAIPDYADPRSHIYFSRNLVGIGHGDNGSAYRLSFDTTCGLKPTQHYAITGHEEVCAYCGNYAMPLQNSIFRLIGYTCVCEGAMNEQVWLKETADFLHEQYEALMVQLTKAPVRSDAVLHRVAEIAANQLARHIVDGLPANSVKFEIVNQPKDSFNGVFK